MDGNNHLPPAIQAVLDQFDDVLQRNQQLLELEHEFVVQAQLGEQQVNSPGNAIEEQFQQLQYHQLELEMEQELDMFENELQQQHNLGVVQPVLAPIDVQAQFQQYLLQQYLQHLYHQLHNVEEGLLQYHHQQQQQQQQSPYQLDNPPLHQHEQAQELEHQQYLQGVNHDMHNLVQQMEDLGINELPQVNGNRMKNFCQAQRKQGNHLSDNPQTVVCSMHKCLQEPDLAQSIEYIVEQSSLMDYLLSTITALYLMQHVVNIDDDNVHVPQDDTLYSLLGQSEFYRIAKLVVSVCYTPIPIPHDADLDEMNNIQHQNNLRYAHARNIQPRNIDPNNPRPQDLLFNQLLEIRNEHVDMFFDEFGLFAKYPNRRWITRTINNNSNVLAANFRNHYWMNYTKFQERSIRQFVTNIYKEYLPLTPEEEEDALLRKKAKQKARRKKAHKKKRHQRSKRRNYYTHPGRQHRQRTPHRVLRRALFIQRLKIMEGGGGEGVQPTKLCWRQLQQNDLYNANHTLKERQRRFNALIKRMCGLVNNVVNNNNVNNNNVNNNNNDDSYEVQRNQFLQDFGVYGEIMIGEIETHREKLQPFIHNNNEENNTLHDHDAVDDGLLQNYIAAENANAEAVDNDNNGFYLRSYGPVVRNIRSGINSNNQATRQESFRRMTRYYKFLNVAAPCPLHKPKPFFVSVTNSSYREIINVFLNIHEPNLTLLERNYFNGLTMRDIFKPPKRERGDKIFGDTIKTNNVEVHWTSRRIKTPAEVEDMERRRAINAQYVAFNQEQNNTPERKNRCSHHKAFFPDTTMTPDQLMKRLYYSPHTFAFPPQGFRTDHHVLKQHSYNSLGHKLDGAGNNLNVEQPPTLCHECIDERNDPNPQPVPYIAHNPTPQNPDDIIHVYSNDPGFNNVLCFKRDESNPAEAIQAIENCVNGSPNHRRLIGKLNYELDSNTSTMKISKGNYYHRLNVKQYNHAVKLETAKFGHTYLQMYKLCLETTKKTWNLVEYWEYASRILFHFNKCFKYAFLKFHRNFRFKRYQKKQQMIHNITKELLNGVKPEKAIIVWGNGNFEHTIKGQPPVSNKELRKRISKLVPVIISSEHCTSKKSCCCHAPVSNPTRPGQDGRRISIYGLLKCDACNRHALSRDDSASLNIMWRFLASVNRRHTGLLTFHKTPAQNNHNGVV